VLWKSLSPLPPEAVSICREEISPSLIRVETERRKEEQEVDKRDRKLGRLVGLALALSTLFSFWKSEGEAVIFVFSPSFPSAVASMMESQMSLPNPPVMKE